MSMTGMLLIEGGPSTNTHALMDRDVKPTTKMTRDREHGRQMGIDCRKGTIKIRGENT